MNEEDELMALISQLQDKTEKLIKESEKMDFYFTLLMWIGAIIFVILMIKEAK